MWRTWTQEGILRLQNFSEGSTIHHVTNPFKLTAYSPTCFATLPGT